jgi:pyruvate ferredoxin oxidoreductase gamma subunit
MKEIRIHARAGQGAITIASILGQAYFMEGKFAYVFPHFGAARMGAPMNAYIRVDDNPVRLRSQIYEPDYLIIVDFTLIKSFDALRGLKEDGIAIINEKEGEDIPKPKKKQKFFIVPANKIALSVMGRPLGNTALLGAFSAATKQIKIESLIEATKRRFSGKISEQNIEAIKKGYEFIK